MVVHRLIGIPELGSICYFVVKVTHYRKEKKLNTFLGPDDMVGSVAFADPSHLQERRYLSLLLGFQKINLVSLLDCWNMCLHFTAVTNGDKPFCAARPPL